MMRDLTKAQLTIGLLAVFATGWGFFTRTQTLYQNEFLIVIGLTILQLIALIILSTVIITILEWMDIFDLKTNSVMTLITLIAFSMVLMQ